MKTYNSIRLEGQNYEIEFLDKLYFVSKIQREWVTVLENEKKIKTLYASDTKKGIMNLIINNNDADIKYRKLVTE